MLKWNICNDLICCQVYRLADTVKKKDKNSGTEAYIVSDKEAKK